MSHQHKLTNIYGNWHMLAPTGELLSRCDDKRANWYLKRDLAEQVDERTIKLKFVPRGGTGRDANIPYMLEEKSNVCVVCGTEHELTRHHVVPYQYRREFPLAYKSKSSYDVLLICIEHHEEYETQAQHYSKRLEAKCGVEPYKALMSAEQKSLRRCRGMALALLTQGDKLPIERQHEIKAMLMREFGTEDAQHMLNITEQPKTLLDAEKRHAFQVVRAVLERNELQLFVEGWRQHFVDTMQPKFLSPLWTVTQPIERMT